MPFNVVICDWILCYSLLLLVTTHSVPFFSEFWSSLLDIKVYHSISLRFNIKIQITIITLLYIHFDIEEMNRFKCYFICEYNAGFVGHLIRKAFGIYRFKSMFPLWKGRNEIRGRESVPLSDPRGIYAPPELHCTVVASAFPLFSSILDYINESFHTFPLFL